ncbi:MAG: ABC transporter ATP-binding protein [Thiohalocapsa sp.]|jgi:ABC-2 type transport system ATP-binding protein|uniref:ABC transporter ATP-binding protein n=1 Tax=Thiohalocapsa sp. TaxID=2497641 RepID=UPI0025F5489D|nr:ABC transporter ATP-binding protein [Thiohalocapsa sp.]MCG6941713.1 ABC transporter ATP-binding protein [Thiohalocapsa sp.]
MHALVVEQLRKVYRTGFEALKGVDLRVEEGDFFALLGPNGAGKSTLIGIVTSLVNKTAGSVRVFEHDLDHEPEAVKASLGVVPQEFNFNLFLPVAEVVINQAGYFGIPRREAKARTEFLLKKLDLWERRRSEMRLLSGGMKRRLMIARALVHRPRLLILDEPTAGVDIEIRRAMWDYLRELNAEGTTIILTTHYLEEAESLCRNVAVIDHGRIEAVAETQALLAGLDTETFVLNLRRPLGQLPQIAGFGLTAVDATTLEAQLRRGQSLNELFAALGAQGVEVVSMRNKQNRLEQLFLEMVARGRSGTAARAA